MTNLDQKFEAFQSQIAQQHSDLLDKLDAVISALGAPATTPTTTLADVAAILNVIHADTMSMDGKLLQLRNAIGVHSGGYSPTALAWLSDIFYAIDASNGALTQHSTLLTQHSTLLESIRDCSCQEEGGGICDNYTGELAVQFLDASQGPYTRVWEEPNNSQFSVYLTTIAIFPQSPSFTAFGYHNADTGYSWLIQDYEAIYRHNQAQIGVYNSGDLPLYVCWADGVESPWNEQEVAPGVCWPVPTGEKHLFAIFGFSGEGQHAAVLRVASAG